MGGIFEIGGIGVYKSLKTIKSAQEVKKI